MNKIQFIIYTSILFPTLLLASTSTHVNSGTSELGISIKGQSEKWIVVEKGKTVEYSWFDPKYGVIRHRREINPGEVEVF